MGPWRVSRSRTFVFVSSVSVIIFSYAGDSSSYKVDTPHTRPSPRVFLQTLAHILMQRMWFVPLWSVRLPVTYSTVQLYLAVGGGGQPPGASVTKPSMRLGVLGGVRGRSTPATYAK